ncbi:putative esterase [hydrothermal vent metagenome]|uniref:Putative esterase n=1 Tax=hydrothermal vent metagenome TaxID=652676 RepID=A0A3B0RYV3_9ZZZZ
MGRPASKSKLPVTWLIPEHDKHRGLMVYVHGGSFLVGASPLVIKLMKKIARKAGLALVMPQQRLAPEHPCPAAIDDIGGFLDALAEQGFAAKNIVLAGEQTGANLLLAALQQPNRLQQFCPAAQIYYSPWLDLTLSSVGSFMNRLGISQAQSREFAGMVPLFYLGMNEQSMSTSDPLASPINGPLAGLPPTLIHACESDIQVDDAKKLATEIKANSGKTTLHVWPRVRHMWQRYDMRYCQKSVEISAEFLLAHLPE